MNESITVKIEKSMEIKNTAQAFNKMGLTALQVLDKAQAQCISVEVRKECQMN